MKAPSAPNRLRHSRKNSETAWLVLPVTGLSGALWGDIHFPQSSAVPAMAADCQLIHSGGKEICSAAGLRILNGLPVP